MSEAGAGRRRMARAVMFVVSASLLAAAQVASAADVRLDRTFGGGDGRVETNLVPANDFAWAVEVQDDGRIVTAGISVVNDRVRWTVLRYGVDGRLDPTFGGDGVVVTDFKTRESAAHAVTIDDDGRIVVVGSTFPSNDDVRIGVARYHPSGALDRSFSEDGLLQTGVTYTDDYGRDVAIDSEGRIVIGAQGRRSDFAALRLRPNGARDGTFNGDGVAVFDIDGRDDPQALVVDRDDRVVLGGTAGFDPQQHARFALLRLDENGRKDESFGRHGFVRTQLSSTADVLVGMDVDTEGRIVAVGGSGRLGGYGRFAIARYRPGGALDRDFAVGGKRLTDMGDGLAQAADVEVRGDRIFVSGDVHVDEDFTRGEVGVAVYGTRGALLARATTNLSAGYDAVTESAFQPGRGLITAGFADAGDRSALLRYRG